jgi:hypothetical protein
LIGSPGKEVLDFIPNILLDIPSGMAPSDSEGDEIDDLEFENGTSDADGDEEEGDEEVLDALDNDPDDATEGDEVCSIGSFCTLLT